MDIGTLSRKFSEAGAKFGDLRIGIIGDFAVDAYWMLDDGAGELSVETGRRAYAVARQRYSLGGAGNVMSNLAALGVGRLEAIGVRGDDLFGGVLVSLLADIGVDTGGLIVQREGWDTHVWAKPHVEGEELRRLDFGFFNRVSGETRDNLLDCLAGRLSRLDALIVNQQLPLPLLKNEMIGRINELASRFKDKLFVVDSREDIDSCRGMVRKVDQASLLRAHRELESVDQDAEEFSLEDVRAAAEEFFARRAHPVVITRGRRGCLVFDSGEIAEIPAVFVLGPVDPVGAGDTMLAALTTCLAAGMEVGDAALTGNYAAAVTVGKLRQTGTASCGEIADRIAEARLVYRPDLAEDERGARNLEGSRIEIVDDSFTRGQATHVIFDHDGTISTLRQAWEPIMERVMLEAVFGGKLAEVPLAEYERVRGRVEEFIDQSTGVQTIVQMQGLAGLVAEFGYVPAADRLDAAGYKAGYVKVLLEMVNDRLERLEAGELVAEDFMVKGALEMLETLRRRGATLYLASGTDREDVVREAERMGYAELFNGGIHGSVGDISKFSKRKLIAELIENYDLEGAQLLTFGDGPVEIAETVRHGGVAVGVASDEVRRWGVNPSKRNRLIKAGAHLVIGDYTQHGKLLAYLGGDSG
ncbi:MAG: HAD family hydrolase [Candidatus Glassbacteria bacterium]|nr:HAD family hydrolase [Candidatus Glassbacteria bacterium]